MFADYFLKTILECQGHLDYEVLGDWTVYLMFIKYAFISDKNLSTVWQAVVQAIVCE